MGCLSQRPGTQGDASRRPRLVVYPGSSSAETRLCRRPIGRRGDAEFYGGNKNRGSKPNAFRKGSGSILRKALQQLEAAGLVIHDKTGRRVSPPGMAFLDNMAQEVLAHPAGTSPEEGKAGCRRAQEGRGKEGQRRQGAKAEKSDDAKGEKKPAAKKGEGKKAEKPEGHKEKAEGKKPEA